MLCRVESWIMPAMANEPPDGSSTVVSARRVRIDGMVAVALELGWATVMALLLDRSETSVMTLRLMRPPLSTTGVKFRLTPKFLNVTDGWQVSGAPAVVDEQE